MSPETKARRAAARKRDRELAKLTPIADQVQVIGGTNNFLRLVLDGVTIMGGEEDFNKFLEKAGYRPVRVTRNILNSESKSWCIDINTPAYLDPGCESYHTM